MASDDLVRRLAALDTGAVSDARDRLGLDDRVVTALDDLTGTAMVAGRAITVRLGPVDETISKRHLCTGAVDAAGPGDVVSPIAGVVLTIDVQVGAQVEESTQVAALEAMKTKTVVTAGRAGKVTAIAVSVGQGVEAGQALLTIA